MFVGGFYQVRIRLSTAITNSGTATVWLRPSVSGTEFAQTVFQPTGSNLHVQVDTAPEILGEYNSPLPNYPSNHDTNIQTDSHGQLYTDLNYVAGIALGAPSAYGTGPGAVNVIGVNAYVTSPVNIIGHAGATLDAIITAATAPPNGLAVLSVNNTMAPSLTTGQSVALQSDYAGSVFVKNTRRSQTASASNNNFD